MKVYNLFSSLVRIPKLDSRIAVFYIDELHILKKYRRKGIGYKLISEVINFSRNNDAWRIRLLVDPENMKARKLYEKAGFTSNDGSFYQKVL